MSIVSKFTDLINSEDGVGTVMALFWFILCAGIVGLSVDASNAWRHKERLQLSADIAAHAGALRILEGDSDAQVRAAAKTMALGNMPAVDFGRVINQDVKDIILSQYDFAANTLAAPGAVNAITVQLHRNNTVGNPVGTYLLKFAGFPDFQVKRAGTSVVADFGLCPNYEGIWAHGEITLPNQNYIYKDYCVHSQEKIWMPQRNNWEVGSYLGMPNLADCGNKCYDSENPGSEAAKNEINLIMPKFADIIADVEADMLKVTPNATKADFWDGKTVQVSATLDGMVTADLSDPSIGTVVNLSSTQFESLFASEVPGYMANGTGQNPDYWVDAVPAQTPPTGYTYNVTCSGGGQSTIDLLSPTHPVDVELYGDDPLTDGVVEDDFLLSTTSEDHSVVVRDIALITNCSVDFVDNSDWRGVMVLTNKIPTGNGVGNAVFQASASASVGSLDDSCTEADHSYLYAYSRMHVAAKFGANSVTIMTGGDMHFSSGANSGEKLPPKLSDPNIFESDNDIVHNGMTIYSDGDVDLTTKHDYKACGYNPNDVLGATGYKYIRQVVPSNETARIAEVN